MSQLKERSLQHCLSLSTLHPSCPSFPSTSARLPALSPALLLLAHLRREVGRPAQSLDLWRTVDPSPHQAADCTYTCSLQLSQFLSFITSAWVTLGQFFFHFHHYSSFLSLCEQFVCHQVLEAASYPLSGYVCVRICFRVRCPEFSHSKF